MKIAPTVYGRLLGVNWVTLFIGWLSFLPFSLFLGKKCPHFKNNLATTVARYFQVSIWNLKLFPGHICIGFWLCLHTVVHTMRTNNPEKRLRWTEGEPFITTTGCETLQLGTHYLLFIVNNNDPRCFQRQSPRFISIVSGSEVLITNQ